MFDPGDTGMDANQLIERYGTQSLDVQAALVPVDKSAPTLERLASIEVKSPRKPGDKQLSDCYDELHSKSEPQGWRQNPRSVPEPSPLRPNRCFSFPLQLQNAAKGQAGDYSVVQVEVKHVAGRYEPTAPDSDEATQLVLRIRRRPTFLTLHRDEGLGGRAFFTFTVTPFTLFRTPHSGRNVTKSSDVNKLEAAQFGAGFLAVAEPWDFDRNTPAWPFLTPQFHTGLFTTLKSGTGNNPVSYPTLSLVFGMGLRTGVDTSPDATVESTLKLLVWGERLWNFDHRRAETSTNLLFGLGVDIGSFGN